MSRKIIGATVGTPLSPLKIQDAIRPVKTVNGFEPDESGNVDVAGGDGATFTPFVSDDGMLSWTNDKGLYNPAAVNIKGADGKDGVDGFSPTISVNAAPAGGYDITLEDKNGMAVVSVKNGSDGKDGNGIKSAILNADYTLTFTFDDGTTYTTTSIRGATGEKGDPYSLTEADKQEIVQSVIAALPDGDEVSY